MKLNITRFVPRLKNRCNQLQIAIAAFYFRKLFAAAALKLITIAANLLLSSRACSSEMSCLRAK
jgi:hypothetical protein